MDFLEDLDDLAQATAHGGIDFPRELNADQLRAVMSPPGPALVLAGAGSGKTRTLTYRVAWLLANGVTPGEILLLTFTNKAAREMLERVHHLTGVPGERFWGGTFHSLGQRVLRTHGEVIGLRRDFNILDQDDAEALLVESVRRVDPNWAKDKENPKPKVISGIISLARNKMLPIGEVIRQEYPFFANLEPLVERFADDYRRRKLDQQVADYDDLLEYWLQVLEKRPDVVAAYGRRFKHLLVDEYQDTNIIQSRIVDLMGSHHNIMAVGDDAQCIYTWRGAEIKNLLGFEDRHPGTSIHKIEVNYRSTPEILTLANAVLSSHVGRAGYEKNLRAVKPERSKPLVVSVLDSRQEAQFIVARIKRLVSDGEFGLGDMTILYRAHYQALDVQMELDRSGLPYIITSGLRFFEQAHIKDVVSMLRWVSNPRDFSAFQRFVCLIPKVGEKTASKMHERLLEAAGAFHPATVLDDSGLGVPAHATEAWKAICESLREIQQAMAGGSPMKVAQVATEGWYASHIRNVYPNWQERMDDLGGLVDFASRHDNLTEFLSQIVLLNSETNNRGIENDRESIRLTTVHQSKGLEFPVVFVLGAGDGMFPLKRAIEAGDVDEERRLFYVAVTRAMDELHISFPLVNAGGYGPLSIKPSRFLMELPRSSYDLVKWSPNRD